MRKALFAWIAGHDLQATREQGDVGVGPIARALIEYDEFDDAILLYNKQDVSLEDYQAWLESKTDTSIHVIDKGRFTPTDYRKIYPAAIEAVDEYLSDHGDDVRMVFHTSPGTPAMVITWVLLGKTRYREKAILVQSSPEHGVTEVDFPIDLAVEYVPVPIGVMPCELAQLRDGLPDESDEFSSILRNSKVMEEQVTRARVMAMYDYHVIIVGESGTGKELFARAIHSESPRSGKELITVNSGAIPPNLIEAELFGYEKGAFTDAKKERKGSFELANGSTIFFDEIGDMPLEVQVKLLRVIEEGTFNRVGSEKTKKVDVRIIVATNRDLKKAISNGEFREDLLYRLRGGIIKLPPLRERHGDISLLIDMLLEKTNRKLKLQNPDYNAKTISIDAKRELLNYHWPGNVRELEHVLLQSASLTYGDLIEQATVHEAIYEFLPASTHEILNREMGGTFSLEDTINEVKKHYLDRAYSKADGVKKEAARLLGDESKYQTYDGWYNKLCK